MHSCLKKVVPVLLRGRVLHAQNYPLLAGQPGEGGMSDTMRTEFFCPHNVTDDNQKEGTGASSARNREEAKRKRYLQMFPAAIPSILLEQKFSSYCHKLGQKRLHHGNDGPILQDNESIPTSMSTVTLSALCFSITGSFHVVYSIIW